MSQILDDNFIETIVAGVMDRLRRDSDHKTVPPRQKASADRQPPTPSTLTIPDRVITEAVLVDRLDGKRRVEFSRGAVLTPTARDYLRINKIAWSYGAASAAAKSSEMLVILVNDAPSIERIVKELLPAAEREMLGCADDAARLAAGEIARGRYNTVLIAARQTHRAACLANRQSNVRAVAVRDAADVATIQSQLRANVWCLDPTNRGGFELRNLMKTILSSETRGARGRK